MKIIIRRLILAAAVLATALCCNAPASRAGYYGDAPWCAVVDEGGGEVQWQCEYDSVEDCLPAVVGGNRGYCARNPWWRG